jgi:hypothetical protein
VDRRCGTELHILAEVVHARLAEATNKSPPSPYRSIYPHFMKIGSGVYDSIILNPVYGSISIAKGENQTAQSAHYPIGSRNSAKFTIFSY